MRDERADAAPPPAGDGAEADGSVERGNAIDRRGFARRIAGLVAGAVGLGAAARGRAAAGEPTADPRRARHGPGDRPSRPASLPPSPLPARRLGRTGLEVPILALGGHHLGLAGSERAARRLVDVALEEGIRLFDNAESYQGGRSERWLGAAVRDVRDSVLLMSKTHAPRDRSAASARRHLEGSLERLGTDYLDLWQLHSVKSADDVDRAFRRGGAMEYILQAKREGRVRFVGVTGHVTPAAHRRALHWWDRGWEFDVLQLPLNPIDWHQRSFQRGVLAELGSRDIGVLAMKTSADGALLREGICTAEECLRYVWSLPVAAAVVGMERPELVRRNAATARERPPLDASGREALRSRIAGRARLDLEWYKRG